MTKPAIDLTRHHFMRGLGDMVLFGTWVANGDDMEPALVLMPRYRRHTGVVPCIALSAAFKYNQPEYCVRAARAIAKLLGFEDSMSRTHNIADVIHSHLDDLVKMPPAPVQSVVVGEASVNIGGRKTTLELTDDV